MESSPEHRVVAFDEAELERRRQRVNASEAAKICNLSPHGNSLLVFLDKMGRLEPGPMTPEQEWGLRHEPTIVKKFVEETGYDVCPCPGSILHPAYPWLACTPDRIQFECQAPLELKTASDAHGWGPSGSDSPREDYLIQLAVQMMVLGADRGYMAVLIGLSDFRWYEVPRSEALSEMLLAILSDFWLRVQERRPPDPDWSHPRTPELVQLLHRPTAGKEKQLDNNAVLYADAYLMHQGFKGESEKNQEEAKARLCEMMGDAETGLLPDGRVITRRVSHVKAEKEPRKAFDKTLFHIKKGRGK